MKRLIQFTILLVGVLLYSQDTLSVKDGAYGYDKDFTLELNLTTASEIKALQFDIKYDGSHFNYIKNPLINKTRLGGDDSDHILTVKEVSSGTIRVLIYSITNKAIPVGTGKLLSLDFHNDEVPKDYSFTVQSIIASKADNTNLTVVAENGTITTLGSLFSKDDDTLYKAKSSINFGSIYVGQSKDLKWSLLNSGTDTLKVSIEKNELTKFDLTDWETKTNAITWPVELLRGEKLEINVRFNATEIGEFSEKIFLNTNESPTNNLSPYDIVITSKAYNTNKITLQNGAPAENNKVSDVKVSINGDEDITSFQFDVYAENPKSESKPSLIEFVKNSATLLKSDTDHVISSSVMTDKDTKAKFLRVICYSPSNALLTQAVGEIVKFSVLPKNLVEPKDYPLYIENGVLTNKDLVNVISGTEPGSIDLKTGVWAPGSPIEGSTANGWELDLGNRYRNSYNEYDIKLKNTGNKLLTITGVSSSDPDMLWLGDLPLEIASGAEVAQPFKIVPSTESDVFSGSLNFTHDGGAVNDSVLVKATLTNRNTILLKNKIVKREEITDIPLKLLNSNTVKGLQFDLTLPAETKSFVWNLSASGSESFIFTELDDASNPGITHYVGDKITFVNNAGSTHPLYIVTGFDADGAFDEDKQLANVVTNQGATSGEVILDLTDVPAGTYYYICGNHKSMQGAITILPKFSIDADSSNLDSERASGFVIGMSKISARTYRFLLYSNSGATFTGNSGTIMNVPMFVPVISNKTMEVKDGSYQLTLDNIIVSGEGNKNIFTANNDDAFLATKNTVFISATNDFDPVVDAGQTTKLKENPVLNAYFYKVKASDSDEVSFVDDFKIVSGNDDGAFGIQAETGELFVTNPSIIDFETKAKYSLGITVTDGTKTSAEEAVEVIITDDPNAFVIKDFSVQIYDDLTKSGVANDNDKRSSAAADAVFNYNIEGGKDKDLFSLDKITGQLSLKSLPVFSTPTDSDKDNIYELSIKSVVVDDTSVNIPVFISERTVSIKENTSDAVIVISMLSNKGADVDEDGIIDSLDNCPNTANANQNDFDKNGEGDVCEDSDGDGVLDYRDRCPMIPNADQADMDGDRIGDVCDDSDGDGVVDAIDNCPFVANADQSDIDGDGIGDVCDDDIDGDGKINKDDNCPSVANADQADTDGDGIGDVCDDSDGDGILDINDNCPAVANADQADFDDDDIGDVCDDSDGDGIFDSVDNCTVIANTDQADADKDGIGDVCDSVFNIPYNNNKVSVTSASCIGTSDGSIGLSIEDASYDYSITVTGNEDPITITGDDKTASVTGLAGGTYSVCFTVTGQADYSQCFEVVIGEPKALSAFVEVDNDKRTTSIQLTGSKSYNIDVNGERFEFKGDNFTTKLPTGLSIIKISTDLDCQGIIEKEVFISEDIHYYPNPTDQDVSVHVSGEDTRVMISVFSEKGSLIYSKEQQIQDFSRKTNIDLSRQITGTYIVVMESKTVRKTFKIVKR